MRKRDLLHLHSLLSLVRQWLEDEEPAGAYDAYEELGVPPTALDRRKHEHERAVRTLLDGIETTIESTDTDGSALDDWEPTDDARGPRWNAHR